MERMTANASKKAETRYDQSELTERRSIGKKLSAKPYQDSKYINLPPRRENKSVISLP